MFDKAVRLAKCLQLKTSEKVRVQDKSCNDPPFSKFNAPCRGCEEEEACSFMGLRGFKVSKKTGKLSHGPYFPSTQKYNPLQQLKSLRFNAKPPSRKSPTYAMNKIKSAFNKILVRQKDTLSNEDVLNAPIRRENPEGYRHFCDLCYTGLFNYHFVCSSCALEICPDCYDKFTTITSDDSLLECVKGETHVKEGFFLVSKFPEDEMNNLIQATDSSYDNQTNSQHSSNSDVNNTFSSADIQCTKNNENDTNKNPFTANTSYQNEPTSTPIPDRIQNTYTSSYHSSQQADTPNTQLNTYDCGRQVDTQNTYIKTPSSSQQVNTSNTQEADIQNTYTSSYRSSQQADTPNTQLNTYDCGQQVDTQNTYINTPCSGQQDNTSNTHLNVYHYIQRLDALYYNSNTNVNLNAYHSSQLLEALYYDSNTDVNPSAYHPSQQLEALYYNSNTNVNTYPHQTQPNSIPDEMDVDTLEFGTGNKFEPCFINDIKFIHSGNAGTYVLPSAFNSPSYANCQVSKADNGFVKLPPELFYKRLFFNSVASSSKRPPQDDFLSSTMIRRKRRGINSNSFSYHYSDRSRCDLYVNTMSRNNNYNQVSPQAPQPTYFTLPTPPLPLTSIRYVYPELQSYHLISNSYGHGLYNDVFSDYARPKDEYASRVIKTPKPRRPFPRQASLLSPVATISLSAASALSETSQASVVSSVPTVSLSVAPALPETRQASLLSPVPIASLSATPALSETPGFSPPAASMLHISARALTPESFNAHWQTHQPAMISESTTGSKMDWTPEMFENICANETLEATDIDGSKFQVSGKDYFAAFSDRVKRKELCLALGSTEVLKVKDLPPNKSLKAEYPGLYQDFMNTLVTPEYCTADGYFNLANRLPEEYLPPDLGPKLFISYGSDESGRTGKTNLHCDMTDAVNVMYYADDNTSDAVPVASALWHIFPYESFKKVCLYIAGHKEIGSLHPILDHAFYLDEDDLKALEREYGVVPFTLHQNPGDTVYIPAGCAHQVKNYSNSIKCAFDFVSPENADRSVYISDCFRDLKREDKLQIATTLAFAWTSLNSDQI